MSLPVVKALLGHYRRHPLQILLVWLGLTFGVALLVGVLAVNHHAKQSYSQGEKLFSNPFPYRVRAEQRGEKVPQGFYIQLRREGFKQCVPIEYLPLETSDNIDINLIGIDPVVMINLLPNASLGNIPTLDLMKPPYPVMVGQSLSDYMGFRHGEYITLGDGTRLGPIKVVSNNILPGSRVIADIALIRMIRKNAGFSLVACGQLNSSQFDRITELLPPDLIIEQNKQAELEPLTRAFHLNLLAMGMLAFVVGLFIFYQAMSLSFVQRQPLVGILRQIGVSGWQLTMALLVEISLWVMVSWFSGNVAGLALAQKLMPTVSASLNDLYNANVDLTVQWSWEWSGLSLLMVITGCLLACGWPLVRLIRSRPIRLSARLSLIRFAGREFGWQAMFACIFCVAAVAVAVYQMPHDQMAGFVLIALLLISVGLIMPFIIWKLFSGLSVILPGVRSRWFFADAAASLSYRGVAAMAFMLALASNVGIETMVGSFRATTDTWLSQRLAADVYIRPAANSAPRMSSWLEEQPEVKEVWWQWRKELDSENGTLQVMSLGTSKGENRALSIKVAIPDYWYYFHNSHGVMISESMALKLKLQPGDTLTLPEPIGQEWKIVGVYYDYGNPYNQVLLSHHRWLNALTGEGDVGLGVLLKEGADRKALLTRIGQAYRLSPERVQDNSNIHSQAMRVFDRTFVVTETLDQLTLFIAICGLFFATLAGEISRQRQFALLRCMGMTGRELVMLGGLQLLVIGFITMLVALPLGLVLAQLLIDVVMKYSFGWTMEMTLFPLNYMKTFGFALLALMVAGAWPVWRMIKRPAISSLRDAL